MTIKLLLVHALQYTKTCYSHTFKKIIVNYMPCYIIATSPFHIYHMDWIASRDEIRFLALPSVYTYIYSIIFTQR